MLLVEVQYQKNGTFIRTLKFLYDEHNAVVGISVKNAGETRFTGYYYAKNLQGDVVVMYLITVEPPRLIATYEYDEWGKVKTVRDATGAILTDPAHLANRNPFGYRGYHYDSETGFYYLQSRYYDPAISRFINADSYGSTGQAFLGTNMFAYCNNNAANLKDAGGSIPNRATIMLDTGENATPPLPPTKVTVDDRSQDIYNSFAVQTAISSAYGHVTSVTLTSCDKPMKVTKLDHFVDYAINYGISALASIAANAAVAYITNGVSLSVQEATAVGLGVGFLHSETQTILPLGSYQTYKLTVSGFTMIPNTQGGYIYDCYSVVFDIYQGPIGNNNLYMSRRDSTYYFGAYRTDSLADALYYTGYFGG